MPVEEQVVCIFAGTRGFLDKVEVTQVTRFEAALLDELRARRSDILQTIRDKRELTPDTEKELIAFLDEFAKVFA